MLSEFFCNRGTLRRVQNSPSAPYLESFADAMRALGYARTTILEYLRTAAHVGAWAQCEGIALSDLDETAIEAFRSHLSVCECPGPRPARSRSGTLGARAHCFLDHLRATGAARSAAPLAGPPLEPVLLSGFNDWMRQHRGARPATLRSYGRILLDAIGELGDDPSHYDVATLRTFVLDHASRQGRSKAKLIVTAMRMFLRYLSSEGQCPAGLEGAIPTIAHWRLSALPRYLTPTEVDRVLATCDPTTPGGSRDRAVLLLLGRLGLRASDVAALRFSDIDWQQATVRVAGKSRRTSRLPLPQDVGDALFAYLESSRPAFQTERVFLRLSPPLEPIAPSTVSSLVRRAIRKAGIASPAKGAHVLRHSAAVGMLQDGASLDQIRTVLRHRDVETTRLYAKVDIGLLQQVTQPWPEVTP